VRDKPRMIHSEEEWMSGRREGDVVSFGPFRLYVRQEPNFSYRMLRWIYPAFRVLFPNQVIRADDLGRVMVDMAVRGTAEERGPVFENRDIRALVGSLHPQMEPLR
jgi:hypothetical protein